MAAISQKIKYEIPRRKKRRFQHVRKKECKHKRRNAKFQSNERRDLRVNMHNIKISAVCVEVK